MNRRYILPIATLVFALMFGAGLYVINLVEEQHLAENRRVVAEIGQNHAAALQRQMDHSLSATYALASLLRQNGGHLENFDGLAADIIHTYGGISILALAPNAVVSQIYPLTGNENAIGHDLLADEMGQPEVLEAIESRSLTLAGPFELIQGGTAMVGRLPIFMEDETGLEKFWRLSTALIPMPDFVEASGLDELTDKGYRYQLARFNPDSGEMEVLLPAQEPLVNPVDAVVTVPNGRWKLSLEPLEGWRRSRSSVYFTSVLLIVCLLMAFLIYLILRQPVILRRHIDIRTRELAESNQLLQEEVKERVSAETALRTSEARVRAIVETAPNGIIILDNSFRVTSINSAALTMFDYGAGQIVGRDSTLLVPDCAELFGAGEPHVDSQGDDVVCLTVERDTVAIRKGGEHFPAAVSGSFVRLDDTEFYTLVVRDVTARKEMDRLRNEFVATVSHELRTPLAAVMGFLETVLSQRSGPLNDVQNRHLGLSYKAAQRLNRHVEELLTVSKIQQGQLRLNRKDFDPALAVENAVNVVSPLALARSIDLQTFLDHEGCETVVGDRERLEQVLINLASNAIKFTPEHGRISIHSRVESGRWHFSVEDNGIGIASDEVEQAFRRFHRGKNVEDEQVQGAGLGLYICRIIVEAHGGTISLSSVFGEGTTVSVMVSDTGEGTVLDPARMLHSV